MDTPDVPNQVDSPSKRLVAIIFLLAILRLILKPVLFLPGWVPPQSKYIPYTKRFGLFQCFIYHFSFHIRTSKVQACCEA